MSLYWGYSQNNSGGFFKEPAIEVWIEAQTEEDADRIAKENGIYFSIFSGQEGDCLDCCGARWGGADWCLPKVPEPSKYVLQWEKESGIPAQLIIKGENK